MVEEKSDTVQKIRGLDVSGCSEDTSKPSHLSLLATILFKYKCSPNPLAESPWNLDALQPDNTLPAYAPDMADQNYDPKKLPAARYS